MYLHKLYKMHYAGRKKKTHTKKIKELDNIMRTNMQLIRKKERKVSRGNN